jgi:hypothetical protein
LPSREGEVGGVGSTTILLNNLFLSIFDDLQLQLQRDFYSEMIENPFLSAVQILMNLSERNYLYIFSLRLYRTKHFFVALPQNKNRKNSS